jgi:hypothetical protein
MTSARIASEIGTPQSHRGFLGHLYLLKDDLAVKAFLFKNAMMTKTDRVTGETSQSPIRVCVL